MPGASPRRDAAGPPPDVGGGPALGARDVRFGRGGTVSFESLPSEFGQKSSKFCSHSGGIRQKSINFDESLTFATTFGEIPRKFHQNLCKIR